MMFESAKDLMRARRDVLDHDQTLLSRVEQEGLLPSEAWATLVQLQSDMTRVYACEEYLSTLVGPGKIDRAGDEQIRFVQQEFSLSFHLGEERRRCVVVDFDGVRALPSGLLQPVPSEMSVDEKRINAYIEAMKSNASCKVKSDIRIPASVIKPAAARVLYYLCVVTVSDFIQGRQGVSYWEHQLSSMKTARDAQNSKLLADWATRRNLVQTFRVGLYRHLKQLGLPIYLGDIADALLAENLFSCAEA